MANLYETSTDLEAEYHVISDVVRNSEHIQAFSSESHEVYNEEVDFNGSDLKHAARALMELRLVFRIYVRADLTTYCMLF